MHSENAENVNRIWHITQEGILAILRELGLPCKVLHLHLQGVSPFLIGNASFSGIFFQSEIKHYRLEKYYESLFPAFFLAHLLVLEEQFQPFPKFCHLSVHIKPKELP